MTSLYKLAVVAGIVIGSGIYVCQQVSAQETSIVMDAVDFLVDGDDYMGKTVTLTSVTFSFATTNGIGWKPQSVNESRTAKDWADKENMREALKTCPGIGVFDERCTGMIVGTVVKSYDGKPTLSNIIVTLGK